jgi:glycosyltransferase involved in cell wall biosynthesis
MSPRSVRTVCICYPQIPFFQGGTELLCAALRDELCARGYEATLVSMPFRWYPKDEIGKSCLAWRMLDLSESNGKKIDLVIGTKFPSYVVNHERKVTWLVHQFRQVYDLLGTEFSEFRCCAEDQPIREMIVQIDRKTLLESRRIFTISRNVEQRLRHFLGIEGTTLYPPPRGRDRFRSGEFGSYVLAVGRLEATKRLAPLVEAMRFTDPEMRCVLVGRGQEEATLRSLAERAGVADRVQFRPEVDFDELVRLYSGCLAVYYAPFDEDYGLVAVEAFLSHKPVITAPDSGGPLEFVEDGVTGIVVEPRAAEIGERIRRLHADRRGAEALGHAGFERVKHVDWDPVIDALLSA